MKPEIYVRECITPFQLFNNLVLIHPFHNQVCLVYHKLMSFSFHTITQIASHLRFLCFKFLIPMSVHFPARLSHSFPYPYHSNLHDLNQNYLKKNPDSDHGSNQAFIFQILIFHRAEDDPRLRQFDAAARQLFPKFSTYRRQKEYLDLEP